MGAVTAIPGFIMVIVSGNVGIAEIFVLGVFIIGFSGGLFGHGTLTATMQNAPESQSG